MGKAIKRVEIEQIVRDSLDELLARDPTLLADDVSERSITHKLAEYLQNRIPNLHVDCEYNRNAALGDGAPKTLHILSSLRQSILSEGLQCGGLQEDDLLAVSTYPDIIVHRRRFNRDNLLVIEVKKRHSKIDRDYDYRKLIGFTETTDFNDYGFKYGVFILLDTDGKPPKAPELTWFVDGKIEAG